MRKNLLQQVTASMRHTFRKHRLETKIAKRNIEDSEKAAKLELENKTNKKTCCDLTRRCF